MDKTIQNGTILTREQIRALPLLENPKPLRIGFVKLGSLQYISHLDLQRTFGRVIARSGLPVWYTKGFNPHLKLVFATPLAVGVQSICEYLDIKLERDVSPADFVATINAQLTDELRVIEAYYPRSDFSAITSADYVFEIKTTGASLELVKEIERVLTTSPLNITKKSKSGDRELDLVPLISNLRVEFSESDRIIRMSATLPAGSTESLNPELIISALRDRGMILNGSLAEEWHTVMKLRLLNAAGEEFR